jgi:DNA-binding response OmpR family regulator
MAFMQKPFAPSELVRKVRYLLDHEDKPAVSGKG